jgi:hypothetical protein
MVHQDDGDPFTEQKYPSSTPSLIRLIARAPRRGCSSLATLTERTGFGAFSTDQVAGMSNAKTVKMTSRLWSDGLPNTN